MLEESDLRRAWANLAKKEVSRAYRMFQANVRGRRAAAQGLAASAAAAYLRRPAAVRQ
jgi:hypothetical protein